MTSVHFRILCLHGYRQDSAAMRLKMGGFRKAFKKSDFVYVDAPNVVPGDDLPNGKSLSWFNNCPDGSFKYDANGSPEGFDKSCKVLDDCLAKNGRFDIILGFSQGASMAALYIAKRAFEGRIPFKAAILVSGFISNVEALHYLVTQDISIPTFHVYSKNDTVIPASATIEFMERFCRHRDLIHEGGHGFPAGSILKPAIAAFFEWVTMLTEEESSYTA
uniref:Serine hydrolase FSH domain-containing protein n=1 Tax=Panagrolaimus superbus TaxID=310955 RepID=A0A914Y1H9_9BILA